MVNQKITKVSNNLRQNYSEAVTNENDEKTYISLKERQTIIDNLGINIIV